MEADFYRLVKHIHKLEGFVKLANMIMGTFKGMICIYRPNSKEKLSR